MTTPWLGHRDLCPLAWGQPCDCPCPSCGYPLDLVAPDHCEQPDHITGPPEARKP